MPPRSISSSSSSSRAILNVLTTPSKIASKLDWKRVGGCVLSLDIKKDRIGLAVASHPSSPSSLSGLPSSSTYRSSSSSSSYLSPCSSATTLQSIKLGRKGRISNNSRQELANVIKQYQVCGVVVTWPLQRDTGKMGAACGRVLYTLENLLLDDNNVPTNILTPNRPFCLWDGRQMVKRKEDDDDGYDDNENELREDGFGRSVAYSRVPSKSKTIHIASEEQEQRQQQQQQQQQAAQVWDDFFKTHWPDLHRQRERQKFVAARTTTKEQRSTSYFQENWEDTSSYVNFALL